MNPLLWASGPIIVEQGRIEIAWKGENARDCGRAMVTLRNQDGPGTKMSQSSTEATFSSVHGNPLIEFQFLDVNVVGTFGPESSFLATFINQHPGSWYLPDTKSVSRRCFGCSAHKQVSRRQLPPCNLARPSPNYRRRRANHWL